MSREELDDKMECLLDEVKAIADEIDKAVNSQNDFAKRNVSSLNSKKREVHDNCDSVINYTFQVSKFIVAITIFAFVSNIPILMILSLFFSISTFGVLIVNQVKNDEVITELVDKTIEGTKEGLNSYKKAVKRLKELEKEIEYCQGIIDYLDYDIYLSQIDKDFVRKCVEEMYEDSINNQEDVLKQEGKVGSK